MFLHGQCLLYWSFFLLLFTVKLSDTDIYPEFFFSLVSLRTRRVLKKFIFVLTWTVSPTLIHESAKFSSSMRQIPTKSRKSVDRYHANLSEDATIWPDMPQSSLERHRSQANFSEYVTTFRSTINTYLSDIFGPWLLLD